MPTVKMFLESQYIVKSCVGVVSAREPVLWGVQGKKGPAGRVFATRRGSGRTEARGGGEITERTGGFEVSKSRGIVSSRSHPSPFQRRTPVGGAS